MDNSQSADHLTRFLSRYPFRSPMAGSLALLCLALKLAIARGWRRRKLKRVSRLRPGQRLAAMRDIGL